MTYDAATGADVWRRPGIAFAVGGVLLIQSATSDTTTSIMRVDPADGRTVWTAPMTGVNSAGFMMMVLPVTMAALDMPVSMAGGKFQGAMMTPTPIGW